MLDIQTVRPALELAATNAARYPNESAAYRGGHLRPALFSRTGGPSAANLKRRWGSVPRRSVV